MKSQRLELVLVGLRGHSNAIQEQGGVKMKKALLLAMMLVLALSVAASADDYGKFYRPQTPLGNHLDGNEVTELFGVDITVRALCISAH